MALYSTTTSWGLLSKIFHWVMAVMIVMSLIFGTYMVNFENDLVARFEMTQNHKSFGFAIFVLACLRVLWRWRNKAAPGLPSDMPRWQVMASHISHKVLYVLMFWMPLSGWLMATSSPLNNEGAYPVQVKNKVFGLFELPDPFPNGSDALMSPFHLAHDIGGKLLALVLLLHIAAALKHHFVDRDDILRRMTRG